MKHWLLFAALLPCGLAAAQSHLASQPLGALPPLPETSLQSVMTATTVSSTPGVRYQYQSVRLEDDRVFLAPAWRGQTRLVSARKLFSSDAGEADALLLTTINELAAEGWELLEIRSVTQPTEAVQKFERNLVLNDPNRPVYTGTTSIATHSQTRYLFRKAH